MAALTMARGAFTQAFRPKRLWLVQLVANPILFLSFAGWLLIPVANAWQLALNVGLAVLLATAGLTLHAGTINHFRDRNSTAPVHAEQPLLRDAFCRSLHHLLAIAACMALLWLLWPLFDSLDVYRGPLPTYIRSMLPVFLRRHIPLSEFDATFTALLFTGHWIVIPGLLLPLVAVAADAGFRGFPTRQGLAIWRRAVASLSYWFTLAIAAVIGVLAAQRILLWTPDFRRSTLLHEYFSLGWRVVIAYLLALTSWMVICSLLGRSAASSAAWSDGNASRNPGA
jgi:hypothetical protein